MSGTLVHSASEVCCVLWVVSGDLWVVFDELMHVCRMQTMDEWMNEWPNDNDQQGVSPKIQQKNKTVQRLNVVFLRLYFVPAWDSQASIKS